MPKFMQSLSEETYKKLETVAEARGIKVQELIRCVIIPEWLDSNKELKPAHSSS